MRTVRQARRGAEQKDLPRLSVRHCRSSSSLSAGVPDGTNMLSWMMGSADREECLAASPAWVVIAICFVAVATKLLTDRLESRLLSQFQQKLASSANNGIMVATATAGSSNGGVGDLAPVSSVIVQVSQTNAPGCPVFAASAEAPLGSSPQPTLVQGQDAAEVINQVLAKVYPAEMNGQIGSVRLLPGVYPLTAPLAVARDHLTLSGSTGVVLVRAQPPHLKSSSICAINTGPLITINASDVVVRDMQLDGAVPGSASPKMSNGASAGVLISGSLRNVLVENVGVRNVSATAISAVINTINAPKGGMQSGVTVRGCTIDRCGMSGVSIAKRGPPVPNTSSNVLQTPVVVRSSGHQVFGNRISRTGSHAVCLTGVSSSQLIGNQMQHVSIYNEVGVFGHGIAVDGNCGNDPVETVIISANIIDTVHLPANERNATCTGIEIADGVIGAVCTSNHICNVALGYGVYFGGGIAPSAHGIISSNVVTDAKGYGVWVNARGQQPSDKFPHGSSGPSTSCSVVGNCLQGNAPAGLRSDNVSDEAIVGNVVSDTDGAAGMMIVGGNRRVAIVANTVGGQLMPPKAQSGLVVQPRAPGSDNTHSYSPSSGSGLVDVLVRANVSPDTKALSGHGLSFAGSEATQKENARTYSSATGDMVAVGANLH